MYTISTIPTAAVGYMIRSVVIVSCMGGKYRYGHVYTGATHMTKVFVKRIILLFQCRMDL